MDAIVALLVDDGLGRGRERPGDPVYQTAFQAMMSQPGNRYLVAEQKGEILGCLQLTLIHGISRAGTTRAQIEGVRVSANARGMGLGQTLVQTALDRAKAEGATLVQLTSDKTRQDAHRFYTRLGFVASHDGFKLSL